MNHDARLILVDGTELVLEGDFAIGRDAENELVISNPTVSRRHAVLSHRDSHWFVADCGSFNGTFLNGDRLPPGISMQLRHADRIGIGTEVVLFSAPSQLDDTDRTAPIDDAPDLLQPQLSPFQRQVVECLCAPWLAGRSLDELPTNEEIAAKLGTPGASDAIKAALRRAYAKAGLSHGAIYAKRRALCRVARQHGWI